MKRVIATTMFLLLAACGGAVGPNQVAAQACEAFAKSKLENKAYELDLKALAGSMKAEGDLQSLSVPIVVEPGTNAEVKETLECKVRMSADGKKADVISLNFIF